MAGRVALWAVVVTAVAGLLYAAATGHLVHQPTPEEVADDIVAQINADREAQGLEPLVVNEHLVLMAQWRSQDMVDGDYVGHDPPDGHPTLADLAARLGYESLHKPVENIVTMRLCLGRLDDVADRAVDSWRNSPDHWRWAIGRGSEMTGVGMAVGDGYVVITQLFWPGFFTPPSARQYNRDRDAP